MSSKRRYFWIGLITFAVVITAIAVCAVVFAPNFGRPKTQIESYFKYSINGLSVGAPVKYRGVTVGYVTDILLSSEAYPKENIPLLSENESLAVVRMDVFMQEGHLYKKQGEYVDHGLRIQTALAGITGTLYLEAVFLDPEAFPADRVKFDWHPKYIYVPSAPSLTLQIEDSVRDFLAGLDELKLKDRSAEIIPQLTETIVTLDDLAKSITPEEINRVLGLGVKGANSLERQLGQLNVADLNAFVSQLGQTARRLEKALPSQKSKALTARLTQTVNDLTRQLKGNNYNVQELLASFAQISNSLANLTQTLANDPASLLAPVKLQNQPL